MPRIGAGRAGALPAAGVGALVGGEGSGGASFLPLKYAVRLLALLPGLMPRPRPLSG